MSNMAQENNGNVHGGLCGLYAPVKQRKFKKSVYRLIKLICESMKIKTASCKEELGARK
jgi:hypothetical protein